MLIFAAGGEEGAHHHCGDDAATERVVGVDQSSLLGVTTGRGSSVKAGPVHPEEDRTNLHKEKLQNTLFYPIFLGWKNHFVLTGA